MVCGGACGEGGEEWKRVRDVGELVTSESTFLKNNRKALLLLCSGAYCIGG